MQQKRVYTLQFWLLCLSSVLFFSSFTMIIPELPAYLQSMEIVELKGLIPIAFQLPTSIALYVAPTLVKGIAAGELKGLIIFIFTVSAGASRPFSGKLADTIGRVPVVICGAVVCFLCGFLYPFAGTVFTFFLIRLLHGMSTGFTPTGTSAYVADIAPPEKRGEALGIHGLCANIGAAYGPAVGSTLALNYSLDVMFYASSASAILSILILLGIKETLPHEQRQKFHPKQLLIKREDVVEKRVLLPSLIMILVIFSFGVVLTIIPDLSDSLGILNKGIFFTYLTGASITVRFFAGKASDYYGRAVVLQVTAVLLALAMFSIGLVQSYAQLMICAVLFGLAHGIGAPTIFAWAIDLSIEKYRGRAMATLYIALEIGVGSGALISGFIYGNELTNLKYAFWFSAALAVIALIILITHVRIEKRNKKASQLNREA